MYTYELILNYTVLIFGTSALCYVAMARLIKDRCIYAAALLSWPQLIGIVTIFTIACASAHVYSVPLTVFVGMLEVALFFATTLFMGWVLRYVRERAAMLTTNRVVVAVSISAIAIQSYLILSSGLTFGIFSEGSRLDFIREGGQSLLLTYALSVLQSAFILVIAARLAGGRFSRLDAIAIIVSFVLSILAASKGSAVMNLFYINAVARAFGFRADRRISSRAIGWLAAFAIVAFGYVYVFSKLLDVPLGASINMAVSRFILAADGRALAIDDGVHSIVNSETHGSLLAELFKGIAIRLSLPISVVPLGVAQYAAAFNTELFAGSNAGFGATILMYFGFWSDFLAVAVALFFAVGMCMLAALAGRISSPPFVRVLSLSIAFTLGWTFVQDFQAFFVVSTLLFPWLMVVAIWQLLHGAVPSRSSLALGD